MTEVQSLFDMEHTPLDKSASLGKNGFTARQLTAISRYCYERNLKPSVSNPPAQMHFTNKTTGTSITVHLNDIMSEYKVWNDEDKKSRAAERKRNKDTAKGLIG